jgi:hypothetical protein
MNRRRTRSSCGAGAGRCRALLGLAADPAAAGDPQQPGDAFTAGPDLFAEAQLGVHPG